MREILFRGKRKDNGKWVYGFLVMNKCSKNENGRLVYYTRPEIIPIGEIGEADYDGDGNYYEYTVIPETVGQYTGLTDKNGKKIFEGDILKQKTTPEFAKVNSFDWECYGIVRFGYYDWDEGEAGRASMGWYIKHLKSVSIKPKNYLVGHIQAGLNQSDILNKYYPMEVIGNIHDNPELLNAQ